MQEFSSVTASSYDAEALAPLLTEKAAEGWAVISIVAAGTNIVAYLSRDSADADVPAAEIETEAAPTLPGDDAPVSDAAADADEPAGWGTAPDNDVADLAAQVGAEDTAEEADDDTDAISGGVVAAGVAGAAGVAAATGAPDGAGELAADAAAGAAGDVVGESADAAAEAATATDAATAAAAAASTVPAGWYADPSGRYELRYWDGNAWTEHVSRAGQQFTDPPVA